MILRVWRAKIISERVEEYRRFNREQCLPMLRKQPRFLAVLLLRDARGIVVSITVWDDQGTVEALESSPSYRTTTHELVGRELLNDKPSVELLEVEGGDLRAEALAAALSQTSHAG